MANFNWGGRFFARPDAIQKIADVVIARVVFFFAGNAFGPNARGRGEEVLTHVLDSHFTFGAFENAANIGRRCQTLNDRAFRIAAAEEGVRCGGEETAL